MKLFVDTNVILDVILHRDDFYDASLAVLRLCEKGDCGGHISALTVANLHYIVCKAIGREKTDESLQIILKVFHVAELTATDLKEALKRKSADFEDALQMSAAERVKADYIITRDIKHFVGGKIKAISPMDFIKKIS